MATATGTRRHLSGAYVWPGLVIVALAYPWAVNPGRVAFAITVFALAGILAGTLAHAGDTRELHAWWDQRLAAYEAELDEYDALLVLADAVADAPSRSSVERAAARALRAHVLGARRTADDDLMALVEAVTR
jgi:hypothetical protein